MRIRVCFLLVNVIEGASLVEVMSLSDEHDNLIFQTILALKTLSTSDFEFESTGCQYRCSITVVCILLYF